MGNLAQLINHERVTKYSGIIPANPVLNAYIEFLEEKGSSVWRFSGYYIR